MLRSSLACKRLSPTAAYSQHTCKAQPLQPRERLTGTPLSTSYHGFMPIVVEAVDLDAYLVWLDSQV